MKIDGQTKILLALIAAGLFLNAALPAIPAARAQDGEAHVQRVEIVNWPAGLAAAGTPLPVYIMNGRMPNEKMPQIPVMVVNQRYN